VIDYRTFRNTDPPALVDLWNASFTGRGAAPLRSPLLLEYFDFAKPYFDPAGLIVATADQKLIGFAQAGFAPTDAGTTLNKQAGVVCALGVLPAYRRQGIGTALLQRCEAYLRANGARELYAGPCTSLNPFTFGLYGGCDSAGFLDSDVLARPFFEHHGYKIHDTAFVLQRALERSFNVADGRFPAYRQRFEIHAGPRRDTTWWEECVFGPVEVHEYTLVEKATSEAVAQLCLWEMDPFSPHWSEHAIGIVELEVVPQRRRQGLARFLLLQVLRHLHEQFFTLVEVQARSDNEPALALLRGLGFRQVDTGHNYRREGD
jgi:ribosomal protein S18 acetylase RimI-like enzyme